MRLSLIAKTAALVLASSTSVSAQADSTSRPRSLVTSRSALSGFVTLDSRFTQVKDEFAVFSGAEATLLIDHQYSVGLGGWGLSTNNATLDLGSGPRRLEMGYGGVRLGYVGRPNAIVHPVADVILGGGEVEIDDEPEATGSDNVFVFEPSVGAEVSIVRWMRLAMGVSYRFVSDVELAGIRGSDLRAFAGQVSLRFGKF